jgi:magnesium transporter
VTELPWEVVAEGVRGLESDDAVYILEDLEEADQAEVLDKIPEFERLQLRRNLEYPEDSAGRLMSTDFIAVPPFWSVGQTIDYMRETDDLPDSFYELFVVDPGIPARWARWRWTGSCAPSGRS